MILKGEPLLADSNILLQFVSPEDLTDAKEHPENHSNPIIRVGGYSDYFTSLTEDLQDNFIERTFMNA